MQNEEIIKNLLLNNMLLTYKCFYNLFYIKQIFRIKNTILIYDVKNNS